MRVSTCPQHGRAFDGRAVRQDTLLADLHAIGIVQAQRRYLRLSIVVPLECGQNRDVVLRIRFSANLNSRSVRGN